MKASRAENLNTRNLRGNVVGTYDLYSSKVVKIERNYVEDYRDTRSVACQCTIRRDVMCTCRKLATGSKYEYVGVGNVRALSRKRTRKVYLPETTDRAVGNDNLSSLIHQKTRSPKQSGDSNYVEKKTVSKCIGDDNQSLVSKKLSPVIQKKSVVTSPKAKDPSKDIENNVNHSETIATQIDSNLISSKVNGQVNTYRTPQQIVVDKLKSEIVNTDAYKDFSSNSFIQHIHNLENPSNDKQSKMLVDPVENKMECKHRKMLKSKSKEHPCSCKPIPDLKSTSTLRRRFEALRRGLSKKECKKGSVLRAQPPNSESDPPLEEPKVSYKKDTKIKKKRDQPPNDVGEKIDLEMQYTDTSPTVTKEVKFTRSPEPTAGYSQHIQKKKKKNFFFFRRNNKRKENKTVKVKRGVTTARCEIKDGLTIKVDGNTEQTRTETVRKPEKHQQEYEGVRKAWLENYVTEPNDSRNSVHIRWNNKTYATNSSTILELMDGVYQQTGINFRSRSEITTSESSNYRSMTAQRMHFLQDVQAWMIPRLIRQPTKILEGPARNATYPKNVPVQISNHRWFVDTSTDFSQKIELVLHSKSNSKSSEYVIINIPEIYFSKSSSNDIRTHSSDERIYKIVEYETPELKKGIETRHEAAGDDIPFTDTVKIMVGGKKNQGKGDFRPKITESLRDVATQGSSVFLPKRCDVIGVGIITQRDVRDGRKQNLSIKDELTSEESECKLTNQKKCDLAESYLQEYCRNWMPLGIDLFSWHVSSTRISSENNSIASLSRGDVTKSCPNMYEESTLVISSCETSCSHCIALDEKKRDGTMTSKLLNKFIWRLPTDGDKRHCPKDSLEVYKKRMLYACTNQRAKWKSDSECDVKKPIECHKSNVPCWKPPTTMKKDKPDKKRVTLPDCEEMSKIAEQLSYKSVEGILTYKGSNPKCSPKHTAVIPSPTCEIPQPPCKEACMTKDEPECTEKDALPCDEIFQPKCQACGKTTQDTPVCVKPKNKSTCKQCNKKTSDKDCQLSNTPSLTCADASPTCSSPKATKQQTSLFQWMKKKSENKNKPMNESPPAPPSACEAAAPCGMPMPEPECPNKQKVLGVHIKKLPYKKKTCDDDVNWQNSSGVIRLNSHEKLTIHMKNGTPSKEETNEDVNVKVKGPDGRTLYERIDYKQSGDVNKCELLHDMYKDQQIHRASTPNIVQDGMVCTSQNNIYESKSDINNLIEINFTLKLKQGDNDIKADTKICGDEDPKNNKMAETIGSQQNVYVVQDQDKHTQEPDQKRDVNINIIIKNYNTKPDKSNEAESYDTHKAIKDNFAERISEKFHTVSTGYSDDIDRRDVSIHRATVDLTTSINASQIQSKTFASGSCVASNHLTNSISSQTVIKQSVTDQTGSSIKHDSAEDNRDANLKREDQENATENFQAENDNFYDCNFNKYSRKETNDEMPQNDIIRNLFKSPSIIEKTENKKKIKQLIKAIMTSDTTVNEDIAVTSKELAKGLTYASLGPRCFRDTDSMNNYYQFESEPSMYEGNKQNKLNSTQVNSECSESAVSLTDNGTRRCLCNTFAKKLNLTQNKEHTGCSCKKEIEKDKEIACSVGTDYYLNLKTCIDVETQNSKHVSSKTNSSHRNNTSLLITNASVIIGNDMDEAPSVGRNDYLTAFLSDFDELKSYTLKNLNTLHLADDEIVVLNSNLVEQSRNNSHRKKISKNKHAAPDILHLNETKKAVLEIYSEKIVSKEGETIVAKLPKFDLDTENNITNYEERYRDRKISKRYVKKSVKR